MATKFLGFSFVLLMFFSHHLSLFLWETTSVPFYNPEIQCLDMTILLVSEYLYTLGEILFLTFKKN